ncbi:hypothetical protein [Amycolatopsis albispora]|uniref:FDX-ACB domain-containing protein n=1 Tax=Amycolatopsis albispora TaxID=1804986 RepID=A0A344L507_9PSEU|nr:hypothetical protein [Amycolatopsis albispora]AXB43131.1 hypothetical protein A4R43_11695 [Amycolatopsis albispora]
MSTLEDLLSVRDLTDPAEGPHALQLVVDRAVGALRELWPCEVRVRRGERVVTVADNYDNLGYDRAAVTRDARYTRYAGPDRVLRSHSSALIPAALRELAADPVDDVLLVCPGIVYRRDSIDRLHTGMPHQLDLWRVTRAEIGEAELAAMTAAIVSAVLPGSIESKTPRKHPYTRSGCQLDVNGVEIGECGLIHPAVTARAGLGPEWRGLALGLGLDRILMLAKGIPDIRLLRSREPAVQAQLTDLRPYRPVSTRPATSRDVSIVVDSDDVAEDLGDRVREALGADADCVETVEIRHATPYEELPEVARERLGARPGQQNLLVRIVLRHLDRTLSSAEANELRDRIYAALHQGG